MAGGTVAGLRCLRLVLLGHGFFTPWGRKSGPGQQRLGEKFWGMAKARTGWSGPCLLGGLFSGV
ncbi:hypothetical protein SAM9427_36115 (plasmid) [Streptomyces sp. ETH9427]|nr:hypothetical protein SAM9427_36115 [Streptomyces sp. ETH9427]